MIKNIIISLILISAFSPTFAKEHINQNHKYFLGANASANAFNHVTPGASIYGGYRWHNLGLELGYSGMWNGSISESIKIYAQNVYLVANGFLPISKHFELKGSLGTGYLALTIENSSSSSMWYPIGKSHQNDLGLRVGFGPVYKFNQHLSSELLINFQSHYDIEVGFLTMISLGLTYYI